ncbi:MAG: serine/threonine-protein kinase [Polyangiales bacterium]
MDPSPWALERVGLVVADRYRIERLLGEGAMGAVFGARHVKLGRPVAIKLMPPEDKHEAEAVRRFEQEAVAAASVARRGVVEVLDFGVDPVVGAYIVMELLEGESLEARIRRERSLSPTITVSLLAPVLDALSSVHARSIVHRDLKPANLFVSRNEEGEEVVKILDFGVSRVRDGRRVPTTAVGIVVGTPRFMAPEQARGVADLDARADLYAIGAIAYACLAGKPPYADLGYVDVISAILSGPPTPLTQLVANVPQGLLAVIEKAMARDREARFANAAEMRAALLVAASSNSKPPPEPNVTVAARPSATIDSPVTKEIAGVTRPSALSSPPVSVIPATKSAQPEDPKAPILAHLAIPNAALPPLGPAPAAMPAPSPYAIAAPPAAMSLAPAPQPAPIAVRAAPMAVPAKSGGRGWLVALALIVTLFVGFAAFAVWYFVDDDSEVTTGARSLAPRSSAAS